MIVPSIGNDQEGLAVMVRLLHLLQTEVHSVEQGGMPLGVRRGETVVNPGALRAEVADQFGAVAQLDQAELVFGIGRIQKSRDRFTHRPDPLRHAVAEIEHNRDRDGGFLFREILEFLRTIIFGHVKVIALKRGDQAAVAVGDRDVD